MSKKRRKPEAYQPNFTLVPERAPGRNMIRNNILASFPNQNQQRRYWVEMSTPEFTCVCPASGFPDFATISIRYIPRKECVELKSLKLYINSFRDVGIFHEDVVNRILDDLVALLDPWEMEVVGDFSVRGNIKTVVRARHER